ncbi:TonB-dependent receptor [Litorivicinus lipolyticus]|uniref:TonB-dependent receptor n=1 Tax=Litorivicinus lipolyticus TaxID=418701 RepID=A0A5Q2Q7B2_9GAMM|nr:TonB-dependent receptor [Litorivicinus lipolyticus]QGG79818.1 TonB-dependent receptor [Litorivicinus lipolyticus]
MNHSLIAAALVAASTPVFAEIDPIVITYESSRLGLNDRQTAQSIDVITREKFEKAGATSLQQALLLVPGLSFALPSSRNNKGDIRFNGAHQKQILVMVDGVPQTDGRNGYPDMAVFNLSNVESIEVIRGNASAQFGSGAVGGVVLIKTLDATSTTTELSMSLGSFGTQSARLFKSSVKESGDTLFVSISGERSDGFDVKTTGNGDADGYKDRGAVMKLGTAFDSGYLQLGLSANQGETEYDDGENEFKNTVVSASFDTSAWRATHSFSSSLKKAVDNNSQTYRLKQHQTEAVYNVAANQIIGVNVLFEDTKDSTLSNDKTSRTSALFGESLFQTDAVNIHVAGRAVTSNSWGQYQVGTVSISRRDGRFSPFINFGNSFRAPTAVDVYGYDGNADSDLLDAVDIPAAADLSPEKGKDLEAGVKIDNGNFQARFSLRGSRLNNAISSGYTGSTFGGVTYSGAAATNVDGTTEIYGFNADLTHRGDFATNRLSVTRSVRTENNTAKTFFPEYTVLAQTQFSLQDLSLNGSLRHESKRTQAYSKVDTFTVADFSASKPITSDVDISLSITNAFDREYLYDNSFNAPRRATTLAAKVRF